MTYSFFGLKGVLIQNFKTMDLVKCFEKNLHSNHSGHIKDDIMQNMSKKIK
jgi:hypothetical protein